MASGIRRYLVPLTRISPSSDSRPPLQPAAILGASELQEAPVSELDLLIVREPLQACAGWLHVVKGSGVCRDRRKRSGRFPCWTAAGFLMTSIAQSGAEEDQSAFIGVLKRCI